MHTWQLQAAPESKFNLKNYLSVQRKGEDTFESFAGISFVGTAHTLGVEPSASALGTDRRTRPAGRLPTFTAHDAVIYTDSQPIPTASHAYIQTAAICIHASEYIHCPHTCMHTQHIATDTQPALTNTQYTESGDSLRSVRKSLKDEVICEHQLHCHLRRDPRATRQAMGTTGTHWTLRPFLGGRAFTE